MDKTKLYAVISTMAIYHNNQRYEQGDKLELTGEEAERISLYVKLDDTQAVENAVAEADVQAAENNIDDTQAVENAVAEADVQAAENNIAEEEKAKGKKGE